MALRKSVVLHGDATVNVGGVLCVVKDFDRTFANAYIKVISVIGDKNVVSAEVGYFDSETRLFTKKFSFTPSMDSGNFIAQAYMHLKTLDEFTNAVDC